MPTLDDLNDFAIIMVALIAAVTMLVWSGLLLVVVRSVRRRAGQPAGNVATRNARIQLLATLLNTMANASFTVGVAAPIAAGLFYGQQIPLSSVAIGAIVWLVPVVFLHAVAQVVLGGLRQP